MPRISLSEPGLLSKAVAHASGFSPLCDDAHVACRRLCLTKHFPRDYCHLDHGQHDMVANLAIFSGVALALGSCVQLRRSVCTHCSRKNRHTPSRFQITRRTSLCFENPLEIFAALVRQRNKSSSCWSVKPVRLRNTQDQAHAARQGHPFEDVMATCHPPGIAGEAAETVCFPAALEEVPGETSPARPQQGVHDG